MPKFISTDWKVVVNSVDLSDHAFDVQITDEKEQIDVSGFSPTGRREFLPGIQDQTIAISFLQDFASAEVHATIWPIYEGGLSVPVLRSARLGRRHRLDQPDLLGHGQRASRTPSRERSTSGQKWSSSSSPPRTRCSTGLHPDLMPAAVRVHWPGRPRADVQQDARRGERGDGVGVGGSSQPRQARRPGQSPSVDVGHGQDPRVVSHAGRHHAQEPRQRVRGSSVAGWQAKDRASARRTPSWRTCRAAHSTQPSPRTKARWKNGLRTSSTV